ncbi:phospholipid/cholesterol/gamma-HCH transport system permease protein [Sphingomonas laterariae]|uniref:Phospholipid/cholesterol/gamma-HCH transport system permease protein n=1 Tax=Edaphosphingomonas laterariae TaxID=861865 RepID=A0A239FI54_9SPHN|nr:MlaE family lipid ABC transporter permease subunit [Sphingomonas laterariae]SNS56487.1 phospholipid/cholesterol/gamma-HCH transport system permease protein [Sphingomonas laterariae]
MSEAADFTVDGEGILRFSGALTLPRLDDLADRLDALETPPARIDLSGVQRMDTVGAWLVHRLTRDSGAVTQGASEDCARLIDQVAQADKPCRIRPDHVSPLARVLAQIGAATVVAWQTLLGLIGFFGAIVVSTGAVIRNPRKFRGNAVARQFEVVGVDALAIIGLMSILIGIVIAQQGAVQLRQFGAEVFTINLIGRITLRELGVLMTAIMVAGRSGSAFAAQLGSMKLAEEVDAMRTIGVSPMEALVLPRVLATVVLMPLLGFYASLVAIIGGGILCWISLEIPPATYIQRIREVVPMTDLWVGLIKAPVFGAIVAIAGCYQGMQVKGNAEEVGLRTTAAVVQAIFLVIVLDAFFAVFFSSIGWI